MAADTEITAPEITETGAAVERLRHAHPLVIRGPGGAIVILAAELASAADVARLGRLPGSPPVLALAARRARFLHIPPSGDQMVLLALPAGAEAAAILDLCDPTRDLGAPLRGPFRRAAQKPPKSTACAEALCQAAGLLPAFVMVVLDPTVDAGAFAAERLWPLVDADTMALPDGPPPPTIITTARLPLAGAEDGRVIVYRDALGGAGEVAVLIGAPESAAAPLVRLHSECFTGDLLGSLRCDCGDQLRGAIARIAGDAEGGVLLYLAQEGRGIGLINKLRAYRLQDQGFDTFEANQRLGLADDLRCFGRAAAVLKALGMTTVRLLTNNPDKVAALEAAGITVAGRLPHAMKAGPHNQDYLAAKARHAGHYLTPDEGPRDKAGRKP